MRLKIVHAIVCEQLDVQKAIPPPDPALNYDWRVMYCLMGTKLRSLYVFQGPGFKHHHHVADEHMDIFVTFQKRWKHLMEGTLLPSVFTI